MFHFVGRNIRSVNKRFAGHDEVCAEEGRQDGGKLPGENTTVKAPTSPDWGMLKLRHWPVTGSFYKDDNYRSPLLERGIKLLEMLITGRFLNLSKLPFHPISNEMKALGTSLDLMKVILKILIRTRLHNKTHCFLFTTASKSKR